jgi:hypothetical protein
MEEHLPSFARSGNKRCGQWGKPMFLIQRKVSRAKWWFHIAFALVVVMVSPYALATMHWAVRPKSQPK